MFVAFLGCDGSGKTAVLAGVAECLASEGYSVQTGHWRPRLFPSDTGENVQATVDDPHGQAPRGLFTSILKLAWLYFNWWGSWWGALRQSRKNGFLLFDRYHGDLLVDPKRYRYGASMRLARFTCYLLPQPDLVIYLDADSSVLLSRKNEVTEEALNHSRGKYLHMCQSGDSRFKIIDASQPINQVIEHVVTIVLAKSFS